MYGGIITHSKQPRVCLVPSVCAPWNPIRSILLPLTTSIGPLCCYIFQQFDHWPSKEKKRIPQKHEQIERCFSPRPLNNDTKYFFHFSAKNLKLQTKSVGSLSGFQNSCLSTVLVQRGNFCEWLTKKKVQVLFQSKSWIQNFLLPFWCSYENSCGWQKPFKGLPNFSLQRETEPCTWKYPVFNHENILTLLEPLFAKRLVPSKLSALGSSRSTVKEGLRCADNLPLGEPPPRVAVVAKVSKSCAHKNKTAQIAPNCISTLLSKFPVVWLCCKRIHEWSLSEFVWSFFSASTFFSKQNLSPTQNGLLPQHILGPKVGLKHTATNPLMQDFTNCYFLWRMLSEKKSCSPSEWNGTSGEAQNWLRNYMYSSASLWSLSPRVNGKSMCYLLYCKLPVRRESGPLEFVNPGFASGWTSFPLYRLLIFNLRFSFSLQLWTARTPWRRNTSRNCWPRCASTPTSGTTGSWTHWITSGYVCSRYRRVVGITTKGGMYSHLGHYRVLDALDHFRVCMFRVQVCSGYSYQG